MSNTSNSSVSATESTDAPVVLELGADLSPALRAIETAYGMIQRRYKDTPNATIVIKRDRFAWGSTSVAKVWAGSAHSGDASHFEIMISGENLRRGAVYVAATLLHEAAHARNLQAGILDTDVNGRHSRKFADRAEAHGLTVKQAGWHGWTDTTLGDEGQAKWVGMIKTIERGLAKSAAADVTPSIDHLGTAAGRVLPPAAGPVGNGNTTAVPPTGPIAPRKRGNRNLLSASCGCGLKIRVSQGVLDKCRPTCQECNEVFSTADVIERSPSQTPVSA